MVLSKVLGLKRGFPDHKIAPRPEKWSELANKHPKLSQEMSRSILQAEDLTDVISAVNHSVPNKVIRAHIRISRSQSGSPTTLAR